MVADPYGYTVEEFTKSISDLKNQLADCGIKDEGIKVPIQLGAENKTMSNLLYANFDSLSYGRTPKEMLRILYTTGNATIPGGFFPLRANGAIAKSVQQLKPQIAQTTTNIYIYSTSCNITYIHTNV